MHVAEFGLVQQHGELLRRNLLFAGLDGVTLAKLVARLEVVHFDDGDDVVRVGEVGDAMYVISRGRFGVFAPGPAGAGEQRVRTCGQGDVIGEMALLTDQPRSATVRAEGAGEVLRLDRLHFDGLIRQHPSVALALAAMVSARLASAVPLAHGFADARSAGAVLLTRDGAGSIDADCIDADCADARGAVASGAKAVPLARGSARADSAGAGSAYTSTAGAVPLPRAAVEAGSAEGCAAGAGVRCAVVSGANAVPLTRRSACAGAAAAVPQTERGADASSAGRYLTGRCAAAAFALTRGAAGANAAGVSCIDAGCCRPGWADRLSADAGSADAGSADAGSADAGFADAGFAGAVPLARGSAGTGAAYVSGAGAVALTRCAAGQMPLMRIALT